MTDTEFQAVVDATLVQVEEYIESLVDTLTLMQIQCARAMY